ncbi:hypothetical protein ACU4GD_20275 [Cupriavidus basilensis]
MGPWKFHFSQKEDYYGNLQPRTITMLFNLRSDPFESYDSKGLVRPSRAEGRMDVGALGELIATHLRTLAEYPPVQAAKSFDRSNLAAGLP